VTAEISVYASSFLRGTGRAPRRELASGPPATAAADGSGCQALGRAEGGPSPNPTCLNCQKVP